MAEPENNSIQSDAQIVLLREEIDRIINEIEDAGERDRLRSEMRGVRSLGALSRIYSSAMLFKVREELEQSYNNIQAADTVEYALSHARLTAYELEIIRRRAELNLVRTEDLEEFIGTFGVDDIAERREIVRQLQASSIGDTIRNIEGASALDQTNAITNIDRYNALARQLLELDDPELRSLGESITRNSLHLYAPVQRLLVDIYNREPVPSNAIEQALEEAMEMRRIARARHRTEGITNERGLDVAEYLSAVERELESQRSLARTPRAAHENILARGAFDNASFNDQPMSRAERIEHIERAILSTNVGRDLSDDPVRLRQLAEAQIDRTPNVTRNITQDPLYLQEMRLGYRAMLSGNLAGAEQRARNVGDLLRAYGRDEAEVQRIVDTLIQGARIGVTESGQSYLQGLTERRAIEAQQHLVNTGQPDLVMAGLLAVSPAAGAAPRELGAAAGLGRRAMDGDVLGAMSEGVDGFARQIGATSSLKQEVERAIDGRGQNNGRRIIDIDADIVRAIGGRDGMSADDYLAYLERSGVISRRGMLSSDDWVEESFARLNTDGNRFLSAQELVDAGRLARFIQNNPQLMAELREQLRTCGTLSNSMDINRDGRIDQNEAARVLMNRGITNASEIDSTTELRAALGQPAPALEHSTVR